MASNLMDDFKKMLKELSSIMITTMDFVPQNTNEQLSSHEHCQEFENQFNPTFDLNEGKLDTGSEVSNGERELLPQKVFTPNIQKAIVNAHQQRLLEAEKRLFEKTARNQNNVQQIGCSNLDAVLYSSPGDAQIDKGQPRVVACSHAGGKVSAQNELAHKIQKSIVQAHQKRLLDAAKSRHIAQEIGCPELCDFRSPREDDAKVDEVAPRVVACSHAGEKVSLQKELSNKIKQSVVHAHKKRLLDRNIAQEICCPEPCPLRSPRDDDTKIDEGVPVMACSHAGGKVLAQNELSNKIQKSVVHAYQKRLLEAANNAQQISCPELCHLRSPLESDTQDDDEIARMKARGKVSSQNELSNKIQKSIVHAHQKRLLDVGLCHSMSSQEDDTNDHDMLPRMMACRQSGVLTRYTDV